MRFPTCFVYFDCAVATRHLILELYLFIENVMSHIQDGLSQLSNWNTTLQIGPPIDHTVQILDWIHQPQCSLHAEWDLISKQPLRFCELGSRPFGSQPTSGFCLFTAFKKQLCRWECEWRCHLPTLLVFTSITKITTERAKTDEISKSLMFIAPSCDEWWDGWEMEYLLFYFAAVELVIWIRLVI